MIFSQIGGRPSLDFVATVRWRREPEPHEYLSEPSDLGEWGAQSGVVTAPPRVTAAQLAMARELREVIYRVLVARLDGSRPSGDDVAALNAAARRPHVPLTLTSDGAVERVGTVSELLSVVASDALDLIGSDKLALVRECDGPTCTRLYVDSSRAQNRRWCSNSECGNQAKVAAFRDRSQHQHQH